MNKNNISIATITWARDAAEETLLTDSLKHLAKLDIPTYIADGGSGDTFLQFINSIPHFKLLQPAEKGLWLQAKTSLNAAAANSSLIFYTEPDKINFFREALPKKMEEVLLYGLSEVTIVSRSEKAFKTFPAFQQMTETTINNCCKEVIGVDMDYTYGPFFLNGKVVTYLQNLPGNIGWGWRPYAFSIAHKLGYKVDSFTGDFNCPASQQQDFPAERIYRMKQLKENIDALVLSTAFHK